MSKKKNNQKYSIKDINGMITHIIKEVSEYFNTNEDFQEILSYCSTNEIEVIIKDNAVGEDASGRSIITIESYNQIIDDVISRIQSAVLARLASEGHLECGWDDELNDMVFWLPDENNKDT